MIGEVYSSKYCRETWYDLCYNTSPKDFFELKNIVDRNNALEYAANKDAETKAKADKAKPPK